MMSDDKLLKNDDRKLYSGREYRGASRIDGPLVYMRNTHPVGYGELVEVRGSDGKIRSGQVLDTSDEAVCVQVFEGTDGLSLPGTSMRFLGEPLTLGVSAADAFLGGGHPFWAAREARAVGSGQRASARRATGGARKPSRATLRLCGQSPAANVSFPRGRKGARRTAG